MYSRCCLHTVITRIGGNAHLCKIIIIIFIIYVKIYYIKYMYYVMSHNILEHIEFVSHVSSIRRAVDYRADGPGVKS